MPPADPIRTVTLRFKDKRAIAHVDDPIHKDLSAAARFGDAMFLSCDETAGVDRLTGGPDVWENHAHLGLGEILDLPDGPDGEMDIEGLDIDGHFLWIVGSHSLKRDKPERHENDAREALDEMAEIDRDPNRYFLGRFPLSGTAGGPAPVAAHGPDRMATLKLHKKKSKLIKWLKGDPHLDPFLGIPSKENGFDIEGIAARGLRVWLGLRGPVLRGHAVILELDLKITGSGHLKARRIDGRRRYRKHLIPSRGQGVRDLALDGNDLLILTGPTMAGDGPAEILRWHDATGCDRSGVRDGTIIEEVLELPYRGKHDHPEGLMRWPEAGPDAWLVAYDDPRPERLTDGETSVTADIYEL